MQGADILTMIGGLIQKKDKLILYQPRLNDDCHRRVLTDHVNFFFDLLSVSLIFSEFLFLISTPLTLPISSTVSIVSIIFYYKHKTRFKKRQKYWITRQKYCFNSDCWLYAGCTHWPRPSSDIFPEARWACTHSVSLVQEVNSGFVNENR